MNTTMQQRLEDQREQARIERAQHEAELREQLREWARRRIDDEFQDGDTAEQGEW